MKKYELLKSCLVILFGILLTISFFSCKKNTICSTVQRDTIYDVKDGLIAYYNFNGGNVNDSSGFHNNITENLATPTSDRFGKPNNAYLFNGSSSYMKVPNSPTLTPLNMTIMSIFRIDGFYSGLCHGNEVISKGSPDGTPGLYLMRVGDHTAPCSGPFDVNNETLLTGLQGAVYQADTVKLHTGIWYHCVYTFDGMKSRIYINGKLKKEGYATLSYASNSFDLYIGRNASSQYPYYFNGAIDEVRIYDRALSANAINQLYNSQE
jgi:hypothetical protein